MVAILQDEGTEKWRVLRIALANFKALRDLPQGFEIAKKTGISKPLLIPGFRTVFIYLKISRSSSESVF